MTKPRKRTYQSTIRQQRADETRLRIVEVARTLFLTTGYEATTIDAIAVAAGVAAQTVYAAFRSKRGILAAILDQARFGAVYQETIRQVEAVTEPVQRLQLVAKIARQVYEAEQTEAALLRGAGVVAPALAHVEQAAESGRLAVQAKNVKLIVEAGRLRADLSPAQAQDILWTLTGRELYTMLVVERRWAADEYERWLATLLISSLLN